MQQLAIDGGDALRLQVLMDSMPKPNVYAVTARDTACAAVLLNCVHL